MGCLSQRLITLLLWDLAARQVSVDHAYPCDTKPQSSHIHQILFGAAADKAAFRLLLSSPHADAAAPPHHPPSPPEGREAGGVCGVRGQPHVQEGGGPWGSY